LDYCDIVALTAQNFNILDYGCLGEMTLVFAFKWFFEDGDAVLMVSDTRATTPFGVMFEAKKIHAVTLGGDKYLGIVGGAGDPALVKWGLRL
jgi:hypothetical protein